ncbi:M56 family metallopeptidase [Flectobacillus roseus]|uniref:M56 family metallopeptidase n=2 Tax=Flectobacillus roseus TaxID=502259 RepID=A0ABT6Y901_9BACT|nr:M56 family metallopeptidase [Flectobacillus roseus]MDI9860020.1 M56 family metallopeptidase [Flectobacillus roseus]
MTLYLLKFSACLGLIYLFYKLCLENENFHLFKRYFLLVGLVLSTTIPLVSFEIPWYQEHVMEIVLPIKNANPIDGKIPSIELIQPNEYPTVEMPIWFYIYGLILGVLLIRFLRGLYLITRKAVMNEKLVHQNAHLVLIEEKIAPFSFWNYIFLNKSIYQTKGIESDILLHELTHVKQKHTWDILFVELFLIVFWWNPILYLYKKAIQLNHEFLADREVLAQTQVPTYQQLLLQNATGNALYLTSSSTFSITKKRFLMMTHHTSVTARILRGVACLPLILVLIAGFSDWSLGQKTEKKTQKPVPVAIDSNKVKYLVTTFYPNKPNSRHEIMKTYAELTQEERETLKKPSYLPFERPTAEMLKIWTHPRCGIWIDGKHVPYQTLAKYKPEDFSHYFVSRLFKNAQVGQRKYQIDLMTNHYYENVYKKEALANPHFFSKTGDGEDKKLVGIVLVK